MCRKGSKGTREHLFAVFEAAMNAERDALRRDGGRSEVLVDCVFTQPQISIATATGLGEESTMLIGCPSQGSN